MEKLYNNIVLEDGFTEQPNDFSHVPYLENPPEVIDVTVGRQLFVDDFLTENTDLKTVYHHAKKYEGNPVFKPEKEWEMKPLPCAAPKSGGIFYDEDEKLYKMWYEGGWLFGWCYATSKDGIHWDRPNLDLVAGTNRILPYDGFDPLKGVGENGCSDGENIGYLRADSGAMWLDTDCDPSEKYKLYLRNPGAKYPAIVAVSGDGVHFRDFRYTGKTYDRSTAFYNCFRKKWVYSIRDIWAYDPNYPKDALPEEYSWPQRSRSYFECSDFLEAASHPESEYRPWLATDKYDIPDTDPYCKNFHPELYNVDAVGYESIMVGMFQIYLGPENSECMKTGTPKITELQAMYSRDGYHFSRPDRSPLIHATKQPGDWDRGYVQSVGGTLVVHGDELWIYYIGFKGDEKELADKWFINGMYANASTGLAILRRDGFASLEGKGQITTRKITFSGEKVSLHINAVGTVRAEILDDHGAALAVSAPFSGDCTDAALDFGKFEISSLASKTHRLRFTVDGALYSFAYCDKNGESGGAHAAGRAK